MKLTWQFFQELRREVCNYSFGMSTHEVYHVDVTIPYLHSDSELVCWPVYQNEVLSETHLNTNECTCSKARRC